MTEQTCQRAVRGSTANAPKPFTPAGHRTSMPSRQTVSQVAAAGLHTVTFHDEETGASGPVRDHVLNGLDRGDGILLILTPRTWKDLEPALVAAGHDPDGLIGEGRFVLLDAAETIDGLRVDGHMSEERFREMIEPVWRALSDRGRRTVSAVGDMVDLLWAGGERQEALELERFGGDYLVMRNVRLLCAYRIRLIEDVDDEVEQVVEVHGGHLRTSDRVRLDTAIQRAFDEVLGADRAGYLRRLMSFDLEFPRHLGVGERTIFWVRRHLPERGDAVLERARVHFDGAAEARMERAASS